MSEPLINAEKSYWAVKNAVRAIKANQPKPEDIPQDFWEVLKKFHDKKSS